MEASQGPRSFQTTHWSLVNRLAVSGENPDAQALADLCSAYWYPIYAFIRRQGHGQHDAEDLTQGFFAHVFEKAIFESADPEKGRLRAFLLTCLRRYLADERDRFFAKKRGAAVTFPFDTALAEKRYASEPSAGDLPPDRLYQRRWAITLLEHSLQFIESEFAAQGKTDLFRELRPWLGFGEHAAESYETVAARLGMPVGTLKSHVSRLRQRWREVLFEQVAATLDDPTSDNIRAELEELREWL